MRIKLTSDYKQYKTGDIIDVSKNVAFGLIDSGIGIISKDMTKHDYKKKKVSDGRSS